MNRACPACKTHHVRDDRPAFPPSAQVDVVSLATSQPSEHGGTATRWSLDDIARTIRNQGRHDLISRSTVWRILDEADPKPHKSVYWLNSHDPDFGAKAHEICQLYAKALQHHQQGRLPICSDEKTGMQILERKYPTRPVEPGKPERREHEYIRHGARALIGTFVAPTGEVVWDLGLTRASEDFAAHMAKVAERFAETRRFDWILDNLNTHWSLPVCRLVAELIDIPFQPEHLKTGTERRAFLTDPTHKHMFHFTPKHGSWLNQVELWFGVLARRFLARGDFDSPEDFETRLHEFLDDYNLNWARPYRWTYAGQPLVRDTPFSKTRQQQKRGRACFSPRPKPYERLLYPPRPYHRSTA